MLNFDTETFEKVKKYTGAIEAYQISEFEIYRRTKDGKDQMVTVRIMDAGPDSPVRYLISAHSDDGKSASGNGDNSLDAALATVHWGDLDRSD